VSWPAPTRPTRRCARWPPAAWGDLLHAAATYGPATAAHPGDPSDPDGSDSQRAGGSAGGQGGLAAQLEVVARCVQARTPARVYSVSLGGFDTHADEKGTQSRLLGEVDAAVSGFLSTMDKMVPDRDVVVAAYSEFGRRVASNAGEGTDHGTAGVAFVAGRGVRGGFYGDQPSLTALRAGDLAVTTDFRGVYATLLAHVLDTDPGRVLDGAAQPLGFL
jgi:uncharacterized protein (DUF1501 family)